jgi:tRNA(Ile)-lysidine synthase
VTDLVQRVEAAIRDRRLLKDGQAVLVAVSGGVDSIVLLELLHRLAPSHHWRLTVAHFNHQLRGRASGLDERLVRAAAKRLRLGCVVDRADVRQLAREQKVSVEMAARQARHEFLARAAHRKGIPTVALAHHADDQVELFFVRLLRGAGSQGLAGMKWSNTSPEDRRLVLVRPLLASSKAELETFAGARRLRFREDATNASRDILRNRIRHELLPLFRRYYQPALDKVVLRLMQILAGESVLLDELAQKWRRDATPGFGQLAVALQRRILQEALATLGVNPEFDLVEQLRTSPARVVTVNSRSAVEHDGRGGLKRVELGKDSFREEQSDLGLEGDRGQGTFAGMELRWRIISNHRLRWPKFAAGSEWFDADKVGRAVVLRHWHPGDRFQPAGLSAPVKLQDLFMNLKIPRPRRHRLVVAANGSGEIWWVEGLRISERFKLTATTRRRLRWSWWRPQQAKADNRSRKSSSRR